MRSKYQAEDLDVENVNVDRMSRFLIDLLPGQMQSVLPSCARLPLSFFSDLFIILRQLLRHNINIAALKRSPSTREEATFNSS